MNPRKETLFVHVFFLVQWLVQYEVVLIVANATIRDAL